MLILQVISHQKNSLGADAQIVFDKQGGSIGRSLGSDWILPDPERVVSGEHAIVTYDNGDYRIRDVSTNGLFVGDANEPLGKGNDRVLSDGDILHVGDYEILVTIGDPASMPSGPLLDAPLQEDISLLDSSWETSGQSPSLGDEVEQAERDGSLYGDPAPDPFVSPATGLDSEPFAPVAPTGSASAAEPAGSEADHLAGEQQFFQVPEAHAEKIPEDFDLDDLLGDDLAGTAFPGPESGEASAVASVPPGADSIPPVADPAPPTAGSIPPTADPVPPATDPIPPIADPAPPMAGSIPPVDDSAPPTVDPIPPVGDPVPPATDSVPPVVKPDPPVDAVPSTTDTAASVSAPVGDLSPHSHGGDPVGEMPFLSPGSQPFPSEAGAGEKGREALHHASAGISSPARPTSVAPSAASPAVDAAVGGVSPHQETPAPASATTETAGEAAHANAADAELAAVAAFMRGVGLPMSELESLSREQRENMLELAGRSYRVVVEGLLDIMMARARLKREFRMDMTMIRPAENNPLKFSAGAEDALQHLLFQRSRGFMPAEKAFRESFKDLKDHEMAMVAGMRAIFNQTMQRFEPDHLEASFSEILGNGGLLGRLGGGREARYWALYRREYKSMAEAARERFLDFFGAEFAKAYEDQIRRLSDDEH